MFLEVVTTFTLNAFMIQGFQTITYKFSTDERGSSRKIAIKDIISPNEIFISESQFGVIRGMHLQVSPSTQKKLICVLKGRILGVVLDLRPESGTYKKYESLSLSQDDNKSIIVPENCAWGYEALAERNEVLYAIEGSYSMECERGIRYDSFGFEWRCNTEKRTPILNIKDLSWGGICDIMP